MNRKYTLAGLTLVLTLAACGGGGGGGSTLAGSSSGQTSSSGETASSSGGTASSSSSSGSSSSSSSGSGGFTADPGSTYDAGNGREGVWLSSVAAGSQQIMIVDNLDNFLYTGSTGDSSNGNITGTFFNLGSGLWTVNQATYMPPAQTDGTFPAPQPVSGFLSLTEKTAFAGHFDYGTPQQDISVAFSYYKAAVHEANIHAVTQSSLAASWVSGSVAVQIDPTGNLTGQTQGSKLGNCTLSGTITQIDPGVAKKNLFNIALTASQTNGGMTCTLKMTGDSYKGLASILMNGTTQQLIFLTKRTDSSYFNSGSLNKQ